MRIIDIIKLADEYNKLLLKMNSADEWFLKTKSSEDFIKEFYEDKYKPVLKRIAEISDIFDKIGITYKVEDGYNEVLDGIELPEELEKEKEKVGA